MELNRLDYVYMKLLKKKNCTSFFESMTLREIIDITKSSRVTAYRKLSKLCEFGLVGKGCKSAQADTYYLLPEGVAIVENGVVKND